MIVSDLWTWIWLDFECFGFFGCPLEIFSIWCFIFSGILCICTDANQFRWSQLSEFFTHPLRVHLFCFAESHCFHFIDSFNQIFKNWGRSTVVYFCSPFLNNSSCKITMMDLHSHMTIYHAHIEIKIHHLSRYCRKDQTFGFKGNNLQAVPGRRTL